MIGYASFSEGSAIGAIGFFYHEVKELPISPNLAPLESMSYTLLFKINEFEIWIGMNGQFLRSKRCVPNNIHFL